MEPVNQRERVSRKGWRSKEPKLIKLAEIEEWRSIRLIPDSLPSPTNGKDP